MRNVIRGLRGPGGWFTHRIHHSTGVAKSVSAGGKRSVCCSAMIDIRGSSLAALTRYPRLVICSNALTVALESGCNKAESECVISEYTVSKPRSIACPSRGRGDKQSRSCLSWKVVACTVGSITPSPPKWRGVQMTNHAGWGLWMHMNLITSLRSLVCHPLLGWKTHRTCQRVERASEFVIVPLPRMER